MPQDHSRIITFEPGRRGGQPCIRGRPVTVYDVLEYLASGRAVDDALADFPELTREDILACFAFAAAPERRYVSLPPLKFTIEIVSERGGEVWTAQVIEIPEAAACGRSLREAEAKAKALALRALAGRIENGEAEADDRDIRFVVRPTVKKAPETLPESLGDAGKMSRRKIQDSSWEARVREKFGQRKDSQ